MPGTMGADSLSLWRCQRMSASANACPVCRDPLPKKPPSQQRKFCSVACAGAAKRAALTSKTCVVCLATFEPSTRFQAARNVTCSPACQGKLVSQKAKARQPQTPAQFVTATCSECGKTYQTKAAWLKRVKSPTCSRQCNGKARGRAFAPHGHKGRAGWTDESRASYREKMSGADNPAWKGGVTYKRPKGNYIGPRYVRCPVDLLVMARADGYVMEHRLVMARWVGRPLLRVECVNHVDRNPRNNVRSNLELYPSNGDHKRGECGRFVEGVANRLYLPD